MRVESRPIADVRPYAGNPRKIPKRAVDAVAASIEQYGFRQPIVVDTEGVVIAGHTRLHAAQKLGLESVPVHVADLTPEQARAYRLADNRTNEFAAWDDETLTQELATLSATLDTDLAALSAMTAFDTRELDRLLGPPPGQTDPDDVPENADPVTQPGDVWLLGRHRLMYGDCTKADDVDRLLDGGKPNLMVTDPPYGVNYDAGWRNRALKKHRDLAVGPVTNDDRGDWRAAWALFPGNVAYVWHPAGANSVGFYRSLVESRFDVRMQIIWAKNQLVIGRGHYHVQHEPCWYAVRKGAGASWRGDRKQSTVWSIDKPLKSETGHSTQKPVECMARPIRNHEGEVYDPFVGSGTTLIAAERQGRICYAMEIEPRYVDIAVARWAAYTGGEAERR